MNEYTKRAELFLREYGKVLTLMVTGMLSLVLVIGIVMKAMPHTLTVSFLDIGQGDGILVVTPSGKQMLIDGGPTNKILEEVSRHVSYFDRSLDVVLSTHPDADHTTGLIPILQKYKISTTILSPSEGHTGIYDAMMAQVSDEGSVQHIGRRGDVIDFGDGVIVRILYPSKKYVTKKDDTNDTSVSVLLTYGTQTFLLTGDLPSTREPLLIDAGIPKNITVYKAGHHGSKYSSGEQLLTYVHPEYSVISAGKDNTYGHPNPEAIERLQKYSKEILSTIDKGDITFITDGIRMEVKTEK